MFDLAEYQRERIRDLELKLAGCQLVREQLVLQLAHTIRAYEARLEVYAMTQDEFMELLAA